MAEASGKTFYEELGVSWDIDQVDLKRALKKKALEYHPDKHPTEEQEKWTEKFQRLQQIMETFGDERSREVYDQIHLSRERTGRVLVLMDMNGSLLCKLSRDGSDGRPRSGARPDFEDRNNQFWVRPHAKEFLEAVLHPRSNIAFAIYTSRQPRNAQPQVSSLFQSIDRPDLGRSIFKLFAGDEFSVPDRAAGPYKSKRCLPNIWRDRSTCAAKGVRFDECNTINLDNEVSKLQEHPANGIVVPTFGPDQVGRSDTVLTALKVYLLRLAKESHGDVREYMRLFPFSRDGTLRPRALPPAAFFVEDEGGEVDDLTEHIANVTLRDAEECGRGPRAEARGPLPAGAQGAAGAA